MLRGRTPGKTLPLVRRIFEQGGSQPSAPASVPRTMGKPRRGGTLRMAKHAPVGGASRCPGEVGIDAAIRAVLRIPAAGRPNRPPPSMIRRGICDGKRLDALRLPVMARRCGRLGAGRPQCLSEDVESRRQTLARRSIAERQKNRTGFESSFNQVLDVAQKSAAQRAQIAAATPRIRPDRRVRAAWHISFFSPKNSIRNSQAGLLTQHPRPAQSSRLSPMTSCARLRFTAAVLSEIRTPFPFHPYNSYGHL